MVNPSTHQVLDKITEEYDRRQELEAFDNTKAGVRGLVEAGVSKIPRMFINPHDWIDERVVSDEKDFVIPVIDLGGITNTVNSVVRREEIINQVRHAAETWGFFQVENHGIPAEVLDEMLERVRRFNEQPKEERSKFYTRDRSKKVLYNSNFDLYKAPAANWRDTIGCIMSPHSPNPDELPIQFRDILEYSKLVMKLGVALFELLSEALGLDPNHLNEIGCSEGHFIICHYYPECPEPKLTMGTSKHSDNDFLTILLQDQIGGLQVFHRGQLINVPPVPWRPSNKYRRSFTAYLTIGSKALNTGSWQAMPALESLWHRVLAHIFSHLKGYMDPLRNCYQKKILPCTEKLQWQSMGSISMKKD